MDQERKSLIMHVAEWWDARASDGAGQDSPPPSAQRDHRWLPTPGNVAFTLLAIGALAVSQSVGAVPGMAPQSLNTASTGTIAYQGRLANPAGQPLTGVYGMSFRLYVNSTGGSPLWTEQWTGSNSVQVSDGLFNVMLGSLTAIPESVMSENSSLWLGITVGSDDEMAPRVQLGSVPFAVQSLTIADGSVTTAKLADGAVTSPKVGLTTYTSALTATWSFTLTSWGLWMSAPMTISIPASAVPVPMKAIVLMSAEADMGVVDSEMCARIRVDTSTFVGMQCITLSQARFHGLSPVAVVPLTANSPHTIAAQFKGAYAPLGTTVSVLANEGYAADTRIEVLLVSQ